MNTCTYTPQIAPGNSYATPPGASAPTLVHANTVTLTYPYVSPSLTLVIKSPSLNNTDGSHVSRIVRETRGGTIITTRQSYWPKYRVLTYESEALSYAKATEFESFIQVSIGKLIGLLDYESRQWNGLITQVEPMTQTGVGCNFKIKFTFEGALS